MNGTERELVKNWKGRSTYSEDIGEVTTEVSRRHRVQTSGLYRHLFTSYLY